MASWPGRSGPSPLQARRDQGALRAPGPKGLPEGPYGASGVHRVAAEPHVLLMLYPSNFALVVALPPRERPATRARARERAGRLGKQARLGRHGVYIHL